MARKCRASLPWRQQVATPARSAYLASATTWWQNHWSYSPWRNFKYRTFLFVDIAASGTVSILSSNPNEAYIGCWLKPETLTWPHLANLVYINLDTSEFGNNIYGGVKWWDFYVPNVIFAMNEAYNLFKTLRCMFCGVSSSDLSRNIDIKQSRIVGMNLRRNSSYHGKLGQCFLGRSLCIDVSWCHSRSYFCKSTQITWNHIYEIIIFRQNN